jgi:uncharacterized C2H2 Zn-finger protein
MLYECPRCHYTNDNKSHYIKHLNKQKPCPPTFSNKSMDKILEEFIEERDALRPFKCDFCDKSFSQKQNRLRHIKDAHINTIESVKPESVEQKPIELIEPEIIKHIDPSKQPLIDFAINYKAKKDKYIEECNKKWKYEICKEAYDKYIKECMEKFYEENNRRKEYVKVHSLVNRTCLTYNCTTQARVPKYKGYCFYCFVHLFPDEPIVRNWKVKEQHVNDFIVEQYPDRDFTYNRTIKGGCSRKIPDWFFECLTHSVIVENDENQHIDYSCENKRTMMLFQDLGNRPIIFIRFNPDSYIDENDNKVQSSFKYHESLGVQIIRDKNEWNNRLLKLKETLDFHLYNIPDKEVTVVNLFYDKNL